MVKRVFSGKNGDIDYSNMKRFPNMEVPGHILDMVVKKTQEYIEKSYKRAFAVANGMIEAEFDRASTHNIVNTPERAALHAKILSSCMKGVLQGGQPNSYQRSAIYVGGVKGVGKTRFLDQCFERIKKEGQGTSVPNNQKFPKEVEVFYGVIRDAANAGGLFHSNFQTYKDMLPEYKEYGQNFGIIRAEASALDQAGIQWAAEIGASVLMDQLCDGDMREIAANLIEQYGRLQLLGMTASPYDIGARLQEQMQQTGQPMEPRDVAGQMQRISEENAFFHMAEVAETALLIKSKPGYNYQPLSRWDNGKQQIILPEAFGEFENNKDADPTQLAQVISNGMNVKPTEKPHLGL